MMKLNKQKKTTMSLAAAMGTLVLAGGLANAAITVTTAVGTSTVTDANEYVGIISAADAGSTNLKIGGVDIDTPPNVDTLANVGQSIQVGDLSGRDIPSGSDHTWSWLINTGAELTGISFDGFAFANGNEDELGDPDTLTWKLFVDDVEVDSTGTVNDFPPTSLSLSTATTGTKAEVILTIAGFGPNDTNEWFNTRGTLSATAVPEPSTTALLGLGGFALILRRRK